MSYRLQC